MTSFTWKTAGIKKIVRSTIPLNVNIAFYGGHIYGTGGNCASYWILGKQHIIKEQVGFALHDGTECQRLDDVLSRCLDYSCCQPHIPHGYQKAAFSAGLVSRVWNVLVGSH